MEVHHHAHTPRKKWTHYFWEFLMLFLAVLCGFLSEYQLEHKIEKNREKQFMNSMIEDLRTDTANIANVNRQYGLRMQMSDSIYTAITNKTYKETGASFYYYARNVSRRTFFYSADGTMQQLKNSGGLRLVSKHKVADKIMAYDILYREVLSQQQYVELQINEYRELAGKIFDAAAFRNVTASKDSFLAKYSISNPQLFDNSASLLNEMVNKLNYWYLGSSRLTALLEQLSKRADELIGIIRKEYDLQDAAD